LGNGYDERALSWGGGHYNGFHEGDFVVGQAPAAPAAPALNFRFQCDAGCAPNAAANCRGIVRRAILDGIQLAANAAAKLEASPRAATTIQHFRHLFGHDPSRPVPWAANKQSGAVVAARFRRVARELRTRGTLFRCGCPGAAATVNARTKRPYTLNTIELCPRIWTLSRFRRGGVVLHEMLHNTYGQFFRHHPHDPEHRRDNAHCFEAFALLVAGRTPEQGDITNCRNRPA
jgi:hypothetical protein